MYQQGCSRFGISVGFPRGNNMPQFCHINAPRQQREPSLYKGMLRASTFAWCLAWLIVCDSLVLCELPCVSVFSGHEKTLGGRWQKEKCMAWHQVPQPRARLEGQSSVHQGSAVPSSPLGVWRSSCRRPDVHDLEGSTGSSKGSQLQDKPAGQGQQDHQALDRHPPGGRL